MKARIAALSFAALALAIPAQAQTVVTQISYRVGGPGWYHGGRHGGHHGHGGAYHGHGYGRWAGPLLGAAVIGTWVYASRPQVYAEPVYIDPPPMPPRVAYFCSAYQQYYPSVATCPVPWQMVSY